MAFVMLVSADPDQRALFEDARSFFADRGHRAEVHPGGREAMACICADTPDVLVTDVLMAWYDGFDLVKKQKELGGQRVAAVLLVPMSAEVGAVTEIQENFHEVVDGWIVKLTPRDGRFLSSYREQIIATTAQFLLRQGHAIGSRPDPSS